MPPNQNCGGPSCGSGSTAPRKVIHDVLRVGAGICILLAALIFFRNLHGGSFSERELVVADKYTTEAGSETQFRLKGELPYPQRGFTYDTTVSRSFYDATKTGDRLRSPFSGYLTLNREGRVVARYFSQEFVIPAVYSFVALLPIASFLNWGRLRLRRAILVVIGLIEVAVIGLFLYGTFVPCC